MIGAIRGDKMPKIKRGTLEGKWNHCSIRLKMAFIVAVFTLITIGMAWIICYNFIEKFYIAHAKSGLVTTYESCNSFFSDENNVNLLENDEIGSLYGYVENPSTCAIFVLDPKTTKVYTSVKLNTRVALAVRSIVNNFDVGEFKKSDLKYEITQNTVTDEDSKEGTDSGSDSQLFSEDNSFETGSYFDLVGLLDNGDIIVLRAPVEQVHNDINFAARLYMLISSGLLFIEVMAAILISNRYTNPIIQMSKAAKKMSKLDFDVKIPVNTNDEIGTLAISMNEMSSKLEKSISELKSANLELSKDIKEKEHIEEMRSEFLSHVSHELKTPIALIQGYSEGLKDGVTDDPENMNYYLDVIIDEASKMNALVMKLIDLNELEFGEEKLNIERFDLTELIRDVISASKILIEQSNAEIEFNEDSGKCVWADEFMIEEVVTNYLTNAIHYVKNSGKIKIWYEQKKDTVRVNVFNEGGQIAEKDINKLFIKFYKADTARTREYGGSGIGLSIVAAIMKSHKKDYGVYNIENGVVFYFELDTANTIYISELSGKSDIDEEKVK